jgi:hypothetical protein
VPVAQGADGPEWAMNAGLQEPLKGATARALSGSHEHLDSELAISRILSPTWPQQRRSALYLRPAGT